MLPVLKTASFAFIGFVILTSFLRLQGGGRSTTASLQPSDGTWEHEENWAPEDIPTNEPSIFMTTAVSGTASK